MIWAGSGLSRQADPVKAAEEAARAAMSLAGLSRAGLVFFFATADHARKYVEMLAAVRQATGCGNLVGCSGAGVLATEGEIEGERGVAVLALASDRATAAPFLVQGLKGRDREAGREIARIVGPYRRGDAVLVLFPDTLNCNPEALFQGIAGALGSVPVVGGGAADDGAAKATFQMCGGKVISNGVAGVLLTGELSCSIGVTQAYRPIGRTMRVTACEGNVIESLDGRPALEVMAECMSVGVAEDLARLAGFVAVAFPLDGREAGEDLERGAYTVRNIVAVDGDSGAVAVGREVGKGDTVCFVLRDPVGAREDLKAMLEEESIVGAVAVPRLGLYFNCCARGRSLYGMGGIDTAFIRQAFRSLPVAGFFGYCEIASMRGAARLHNYTGVMMLVSEVPEPAEGEPIQ
jgi:small ligand-binding sensory domain FIST